MLANTLVRRYPAVIMESLSYAWACPFASARGESYLRKHFPSPYPNKVSTETELRQLLSPQKEYPEILLFWGFCRERHGLKGVCMEKDINHAHWEDGFFPHYETLHVDPLGFCWESSLARTLYRECKDRERDMSRRARESWLDQPSQELPPLIRSPFVLWPLQLVGDKVNEWDLQLDSWEEIIRHFRECLPTEYQIVVKVHPRARARDIKGLDALVRELRNVLIVPAWTHLTSLLRASCGVAGANSSVLYEARLMHAKPTFVYARSWFTNHEELFIPIYYKRHQGGIKPIPHMDWLENAALMRTERLDQYTDWFLSQLLARQITKSETQDAALFKRKLQRLSYKSYVAYGESIFED